MDWFEKYVSEMVSYVMRYPPVVRGRKREVVRYETGNAVVEIRGGISQRAMKLLSCLIWKGKVSKEDEHLVYYETEFSVLKALGIAENSRALRKLSIELGSCLYSIEFEDGSFVYFPVSIVGAYEHRKGKVWMGLHRGFVSLLSKENLKYYAPILYFLDNPTAINLFFFFTSVSRSVFVEDTLFQRGNLKNEKRNNRITLRKALEDLKKVGFLKDWKEEDRKGVRYFTIKKETRENIRILATELWRKINEKIREYEKKKRLTMREYRRRKRSS